MKKLIGMLVLALLLLVSASTVLASSKVDTAGAPTTTHSVQPVYVTGNPVCWDFNADLIHFKADVGGDPNFDNGDYDVEGGTITIKNFDGYYFDFEATMPISAVFVKAGNGGNLFDYAASPKDADTGLHGPVGWNNGRARAVSHVSFCWDLEEGTETAFAFGGEGIATCFSAYSISRWGWTNGPLAEGSYEWPVYAGAAGCNLNKGTLVGWVTVTYADGNVEVEFDMVDGHSLGKFHVYAGYTALPTDNKGKPTVAPGQYYITPDLEGQIYVIIHAEV
jgi:hypothetical protein